MLISNFKFLAFIVFIMTTINSYSCIDVDSFMSKYCKDMGQGSRFKKEAIEDLDGDKSKDYLGACQSLCGASGNCSYKIFTSNKGCFKEVGEINGMLGGVLKSESNGLKDITLFYKSGCAGKAGKWSHLMFDKVKYVISRTVNCECTKRTNRPKECPQLN